MKGLKNRIFPIYHDAEDSRFEDNNENEIRDNNGLIDYEKLNRLINLKRRDINGNLFRKYFRYQDPDDMLENLNSTRNTERNNIQLASINNTLTGFRNKIESMSENEIEFDQANKIVNIVEKIIEFNREQRGQRLKILTPSQMFNRLPNSLTQSKAENNSGKLKSEIRQLLYSLYRSKKLTKNIYKSLIDII